MPLREGGRERGRDGRRNNVARWVWRVYRNKGKSKEERDAGQKERREGENGVSEGMRYDRGGEGVISGEKGTKWKTPKKRRTRTSMSIRRGEKEEEYPTEEEEEKAGNEGNGGGGIEKHRTT